MTKVNFGQNSVKGPKDQESAKKMPKKVTLSATMCQKMLQKVVKSQHHSLSQQNSEKFCADFTRAKKKITSSLFAQLYVFCISGWSKQLCAKRKSVDNS